MDNDGLKQLEKTQMERESLDQIIERFLPRKILPHDIDTVNAKGEPWNYKSHVIKNYEDISRQEFQLPWALPEPAIFYKRVVEPLCIPEDFFTEPQPRQRLVQ